jgi:hypothetical protein
VTTEEYFAEKIERRIRFYESCLKKIDAAYLAEVARVAKRRFKDDPIWARSFREAVQPSYIAGELNHVRFLLAQGKIVDADRALDRFQARVEWVEQHLAHRYLTAGMGTSRGGKKAAAAKKDNTNGQADQMRRMWSKRRVGGDSKGKADRAVARAFRVSTKTVFRARK